MKELSSQKTPLPEIAGVLGRAHTVCIYPHVNMDGDALGSAVALCHSLRRLGKESWILVEDGIARNLRFLDRGYCTTDLKKGLDADISLCLDCGEADRFPKRAAAFATGRCSVCIDHHLTTKAVCDYNHVEPTASSTGELIYQLLLDMGVEIDQETAEALYAAIATDTGNFQHSNTTKRCHEIVAALYDSGLNSNKVCQAIYENVRLARVRLECRAVDGMHLLAGGQAAVAVVTRALLRETGAGMDESEGIVDMLRAIEGVEIAAVVKEETGRQVKASFRAKSWADVAAIATALGGGGHTKAAGCTLDMPLAEALPAIERAIEAAVDAQRPQPAGGRPEASAVSEAKEHGQEAMPRAFAAGPAAKERSCAAQPDDAQARAGRRAARAGDAAEAGTGETTP